MSALNSGSSVFHSILGLYWRDAEGTLIAVEGRKADQLRSLWPQVQKHVLVSLRGDHLLVLPSKLEVKSYYLTATATATIADNNNNDNETECHECRHDSPFATPGTKLAYQVREIFDAEKKLFRGIVATASNSSPTSSYFTSPVSSITDLSALSLDDDDDYKPETFESWALLFFLLETQLQPFPSLATPSAAAQSVADRIAAIFNATLRNVVADDKWDAAGRAFFTARVLGFVAAGQPIELCLPAFPCKSPNLDKVGGTIPDRAERIALDAIQGFLEAVAEVYEPGCVFWLISDGHVFSDCIGADDTTVDTYDADVKVLYRRLHSSAPSNCSMRFKSLTDVFFSSTDAETLFSATWTADTSLPHPVATARTESADFSRRLLMQLCQIDPGALRMLVEKGEAKALALYRGMCRFMEADLGKVPQCMRLSRKGLKKVASRSAGEMIARNHAYSNLVELLFPNHVRLSIHAHNNTGPKFGIRLFPAARNMRVIASLDAITEPQPTEFAFQTPTPWHNCVVEVVGIEKEKNVDEEKMGDCGEKKDYGDGEEKVGDVDEKKKKGEKEAKVFVARSGMVKKAIAEGGWAGEWVGRGVLGEGRWVVRKVEMMK